MGLRAHILPLEFCKLKEKIEHHERALEPAFYHWNLVNLIIFESGKHFVLTPNFECAKIE